jgi:hypothetical protein
VRLPIWKVMAYTAAVAVFLAGLRERYEGFSTDRRSGAYPPGGYYAHVDCGLFGRLVYLRTPARGLTLEYQTGRGTPWVVWGRGVR